MDEMVFNAQRFINTTYASRIGVTLSEDGVTGWATVHALTRALQVELGISSLADSFGPTTLATLQEKYPRINQSSGLSADFYGIIQSALYCKGYDGGLFLYPSGPFDGTYSTRVRASISALKSDIGVDGIDPGSDLTPKVFKALLNTDAYVTVGSGTEEMRSVQRWINGSHFNRNGFFIIAADGRPSRELAKSLIRTVQYELGIPDDEATGTFGERTQEGLREHLLKQGDTGGWVRLLSAAMIANGLQVALSDKFTSSMASQLRRYQAFCKIEKTARADYRTWASLLISYGDQSRQGGACDGVTEITTSRARTLKSAGITTVGRYLTSASVSVLPEKVIQPGELQVIASSGLRCFPIYQTYARDASSFSYPMGRAAGYAAMNAAFDHGFKRGARIYFAVDFDAMDEDVTDSVLPYFKGVVDSMSDAGWPFKVGVYGARNVCSRVAAAGHTTASFVLDMSSGFSGNLGYPLPADWAFDQIVTRTLGSGSGEIEVDINVSSGRDSGQKAFAKPRPVRPDTLLDSSLITALETDLGKYMESIGYPDDGGERDFSHRDCLRAVILDRDRLVTDLSGHYGMRKALIQASAYWEMRHIDIFDRAGYKLVEKYHQGIRPGLRDCSTGIAQINGDVAVRAWNFAIQNGYESDRIRDPDVDSDLFEMWSAVQEEEFALRVVAAIHIWGAAGKPGGSNPPDGETVLRTMSLDYTGHEAFEILRRYQGWGSQAESDAQKRLPIYHILEKYHGISRNL